MIVLIWTIFFRVLGLLLAGTAYSLATDGGPYGWIAIPAAMLASFCLLVEVTRR